MTRVLHGLTILLPGQDWFEPQPDDRLVNTFDSNDADHLPRFFKHYADDLPRVPLARTLPPLPPAAEVLAGTVTTRRRPVDLAAVSPLPLWSAGEVGLGRCDVGPEVHPKVEEASFIQT